MLIGENNTVWNDLKIFFKTFSEQVRRVVSMTRGLFAFLLCSFFVMSAQATPFTETVPNGNGPIPNTYPAVGGTMFVLIGQNGNIYYQFVNPSTQFQGFAGTGSPAAFQGIPTFQLGPQQNLNCGIVSCADYFGGSIVEGYARLTVRDADACPGNFDYQDVSFLVNGLPVSSLSDLAAGSVQRTNLTGTSQVSSTENCFRNQGTGETSTSWFDLPQNVLNDILDVGSTTPFINDTDTGRNTTRGDNAWFFQDGVDATGTPEVAPGIRITKTADQTSYSMVGDVINYEFLVENIGSVQLNGIVVDDSFITGAVSCPLMSLASAASTPPPTTPTTMVCTGQHVVTQANIDENEIFVNVAEVTANPSEGQLGAVSGTLSIPGPAATPLLTLTKEASDDVDLVVGETITYTYMVENTGNVTLDNVTIDDVHNGTGTLSAVSPVSVTLAPDGTQTFTATYMITQGDVDAGVPITNTATANATPKRGIFTPPTADESVATITPVPALEIDKPAPSNADNDASGSVTLNDVLTYTITVENTGNTTLNNVVVTDLLITPDTITCPTLALNETCVLVGDYTVDQDDVDAGSIVNTASVVTDELATPVTEGETTPVAQSSGLEMVKTALTTNYTMVGDEIDYQYVVTNTGTVTVTDPIFVTDDKIVMPFTVNCPSLPAGGLAPNASLTCTATYTVVQDDLDNGSVTNIASATDGTSTSPTDTATVNGTQSPAMSLLKEPVETSFDTVGDTISYNYTVVNTGNVLIADLVVTDDLISTLTCNVSAVGNGDANLDPDEEVVCTGVYEVTQEDLDNGSVTNNASATGTPPGGILEDPTAQATVNADQMPELTMVKTPGETSFAAVNDVLTYEYEVENTGNVYVSNLSVTDDKISTVTCDVTAVGNNDANLDPGETVICTASYSVTQDDIDAGEVMNNASATGDPAGGTLDPALADATVDADQMPGMTVVKTATDTNFTMVNDVTTYEYVVTNTGNTTITSAISVTDNLATVNCPALPMDGLAPLEQLVCTATYMVTQMDLDNGSVTNIASATDGTTTSPQTSETIPADQNPALTITKTALATTFSMLGETVTYEYEVTNNGNLTLTGGIDVVDDKIGTFVCITGNFAPMQTETCTAEYTVTQDDLDNGSVTNQAFAQNGLVVSPPMDATVTADQNSALTFAKRATTTTFTNDNDVINYEFDVENTGNVTLTNVVITDDLVAVSCPKTVLLPMETMLCTASYTVDQDDVDAGSVTNNASISGTPPSGPAVTGSDTVVVDSSPMPSIFFEKRALNTAFAADGDILNYEFDVENTGTVTLSNIVITDSLISSVSCPFTSLAPTSSMVCTASYTVDQDDVDAGSVTNNAEVAADLPGGAPLTPVGDSAVVNATQTPSLSIDKQALDATYAAVNDTLDYSYTVVNTGNVTINDITVSDDLIATISCPANTLAPMASFVCTGTYTVTQDDIDNGSVTNIATANGMPEGGTLAPATDTVEVDATLLPELTTVKTALTTDFNAVNDPVSYEYVVTNSGNVTIVDPITVSDDKIASVSCPALPSGGLLPTDSITCTATYLVTQDDIDAGFVTNNATASDGTTTSPSVSETVDAVQEPVLTIVKAASTTTYQTIGDVISYTYDVINDGNTTITSAITVSDDKIAMVNCPALPVGGLIPGGSVQCTASYTVDQDDIDAGSIVNTASATDGTTTSPDDVVTVVANQLPGMEVVKTATLVNFTAVNDVVNYDYVVTNTGNTTITASISVSDNLIPTVNCPSLPLGGLLPGNSLTCTGTYLVTQNDLDNGSVTNLATATDGTTTSPPTSETIPATADPALFLDKASTDTSFDAVEDVLTYTFLIRNDGNLTITGATQIVDNKIGTFTCFTGNIAPGNSETCSRTYTVTQEDLDLGFVRNDAFATNPLASSPPDTVIINADQTPGLTTVKTASATSFTAIGEPINYDYVVTNSGNTTITAPISVSDDRIASVNCPTLPAGGLLPGNSITCTATDTVTQDDLNAGSIVNTATATDGSVTSPAVTETVNADQNNDFTVDKIARSNDFAVVDDVLDYEYVVTNTGNVSIVDAITVTDDKIATVNCPALPVGGLVPNGTLTCTASYPVTQEDLDAGSVTNIASAQSGGNSSAPDTATVSGSQTPEMTVIKTPGAPSFTTLGETVSYSYVVTNTGNVTLTSAISVSDDKITTVNCPALPAGGLTPTSTLTCTADYEITQADLDAGSVTNIASASDGTTSSEPVSATVNAVQTPAMTVAKSATSAGFVNPGDIVSYQYVVTNTGNVSLTQAISVSDDKIASVNCPALPAGGLVPNATLTCTADYAVTQADIDAGEVTNIASATDGTTTSAPDTVTVDADSMPELVLTKTIVDSIQVGGPIYDVIYQLTATNTGNVSLSDVQIVDDLATVLAPTTIYEAPSVAISGFTGGTANTAYDGAGDTNLLAGSPSLPVGDMGVVTLSVRIDTTNGGPLLGNTAVASSPNLPTDVPSNDPTITPDDAGDTNPTPFTIVDTDGDGVPDNLESPTEDRDGDGIPDSEDYDPTGYFYCEENGNILSGGGIVVTGPAGSNAAIGTANNIVIVQDGSDGFFQFYVTAPGRYTLTPTYPTSGVASTARPVQNVALDVTSLLPSNPGILGSSEVGSTGVLADFSAAANTPFYFEFDIEAGDPSILMNNIPLRNCGTPEISLSKTLLSEPSFTDDGRQLVSYALTAENTGETLVEDVQITDDLGAVYGAARVEVEQLEISDEPINFASTADAGFDGVTNLEMLTGAGDLLPGESVTVELDVLVNAESEGEYTNNASVSALAPLDGSPIGGEASAAVTLAPASDASLLRVVKTAQPRTVQIGDPVLYTVSVTNESLSAMTDLRITDRIPHGFSYVPNTAVLSNATDTLVIEPDVQSRGVLTWTLDSALAQPFNTLPAGASISVSLRLLAGPNVEFGAHENQAYVESLRTGTRSETATAVVDYIPEPTFDCTPVIGRVYDDVNHNGYPDDGEPGLPSVRLATVNGDIITTDQYGRYHIPCAIIADSEKGSNFLLKADVRTLPLGYKTTTENPRVVRATRGKFIKMNFGAAHRPKLRVDLYADDYANGALSTASRDRIRTIFNVSQSSERAILVYHAHDDESIDASQAALSTALTYVKSIKSKKMKDIALEASWGDAEAYIHYDPEHDQGERTDITRGQYYDRPANDNASYADDQNYRKRVRFEGDDLLPDESTDTNRRGYGHSAGLRGSTDADGYTGDTRPENTVAGRRDKGIAENARPGRLLRWLGWGDKTTAYADGLEIETTVSSLEIRKNLNAQANTVSTDQGRMLMAEGYWNYNSFVEKAELRLFDAKKSTRSKPLSVIDMSKGDGRLAITPALPTHLNYVLRVYDDQGRFDETYPKPITLGDAENDFTPAEWAEQSDTAFGGNTLLVDNITIKGGAVRVYGRNVPGKSVTVMGRNVSVDEHGLFVTEELLPSGEQTVEILVAGKNETVNRIVRTVDVKTRDHFFVGQIEATIGERVEPDANNDTTYEEGRIAFYLRSRLSELWSLTATADTGEASIDNIFDGLDDKDVGQLLRRLDPDRYYPTYGDDSTIEQDAPTSGRFYARVERLDDYALWGNYRTEFNDTEFGRVQRTLYGAKLRWDENGNPTRYGDDRTTLTAFIAEGGSRQGRDELRGTGGSVYYLRHGDISIGSEILRIETRDSISGITLESRRLTYGSDYELDFIQGRVLLNQPLSSTGDDGRLFRDGSQSGNETVLVVDYEYSPILGSDDDAVVFGARGTRWFGDVLKLGATFNHDTDGGAESDLLEFDATIQMAAGTYIKGEIAQSKGLGVETFRSTDGGFSYSAQPRGGLVNDDSAMAYAVEAAADFSEIDGFNLDGNAYAYWRLREAGFAGYSQAANADITQYGGGMNVELMENLSLNARADVSDDQTLGTNSYAEISADYKLDEQFTLSGGVAFSDDARGNAGTSVGARAEYAFSDDNKAYVFGQVGIEGDNTRTTDRIGVGAEVRLSKKVAAGGEISTGEDGLGVRTSVRYHLEDGDEYYLAYDLPLNSSAGNNRGTVNLGARRRYTDALSVYGEERFQFNEVGLNGLTHAYGVDYKPGNWNLNASAEVGKVQDLERVALSAGAGFSDERMRAGVQGEYREDESLNTGDVRKTWLLRTTAQYQANEELRLQGKFNLAFSDQTGTPNSVLGPVDFNKAEFTEGSVAAAYRPIWDDRFNLLAKYVYLNDLSPSAQRFNGETLNYRQRSNIISVDGSYDIAARWTLGAKYGHREGEVTSSRESLDFTSSKADLGVLRLDYHATHKWDATIEGRYLSIGSGVITRTGGLAGAYRHMNDNVKLGGGIVWGGIEEEYLAAKESGDIGWFLNVVGKF